MKRVLILLLAAMFMLSLAGCGMKQKIENKIGEKVTEKVIEAGTDGKVDIEGDKVTVKGDDGSELTVGGTEWPKSDLIKDITKFEKGKIVSVSKSEESVMIIIEEVEKKDFEDYWEKIKSNFPEEPINIQMDDTISYGGGDGKGVNVQLVYNTSERTFAITAAKKE